MSYDLICDDVLHWAEAYKGEPFHAILADPPYHLTSIVKRFGNPDAAPAKGDVYNRASKGFMGSTWDGLDESGQGIAFKPETWYTLAQHLHPGGFIMAFAGTRGYHRMACAMEDAGLIIHPALGWVFLSGFPKATRIDTQIARVAKIEALATLTQRWAGHRYGLQALKPAFEFIAVAQRPYEGRPVDCIVETGAGSLWIDGGRIGTANDMNPNDFDDSKRTAPKFNGLYNNGKEGQYRSGFGIVPNGRWPANFTLTHSPACNGDCAPDCPVRLFDEQAGVSISTGGTGETNQSIGGRGTYQGGDNRGFFHYGDSGPASRIFHRSNFAYEIAERLANAAPVWYEPKASSNEREAGLEDANHHPTVKPIALTKYLATLLLPPDTYAPQRILVPFAGVASEMIGAILAGWEEVTGIEREAKYVDIARTRLEWWSKWPGWGQTDVDKILAAKEQSDIQLSLFG